MQKVKIGIERRTGIVLGLLSNHSDALIYYLHVDIQLKNGESYLLSCSQFGQIPNMLHYLNWHYVEIEDPMNLAALFNNNKMEDPVMYIRENYEKMIPGVEKENYDHLIGSK